MRGTGHIYIIEIHENHKNQSDYQRCDKKFLGKCTSWKLIPSYRQSIRKSKENDDEEEAKQHKLERHGKSYKKGTHQCQSDYITNNRPERKIPRKMS